MAFGIDDALMLAMAFGPSLFGGALGRSDPNEKLRRQALDLFNPAALLASSKQFYGQNIASPGYSSAQRGIIGTGQHLQNAVAHALATRGVAQSGVASVMNPLAGSATGMGLSKLNASAWDSATGMSQNNAAQRASILQGGAPPQNYTANLLGGGLSALMPLLMSLMQQRNGGGGAYQYNIGQGTPQNYWQNNAVNGQYGWQNPDIQRRR